MARIFRMSEEDAARLGILDRIQQQKRAPTPKSSPKISRGDTPESSVLPAIKSPSERLGISEPAKPSGKRATAGKSRRISARDTKIMSLTVERAGDGSAVIGSAGDLLELSLSLDIPAAPKERARTVRRTPGGKTISYTPARTRRFSALVRGVAQGVIDRTMAGSNNNKEGMARIGSESGVTPMDCPVGMEISFIFCPPSGWPAWKKDGAIEGLISPTARPDMDNLEKSLIDALNGLAFVDDSLVSERRAVKRFGPEDKILVRIFKLSSLKTTTTRQEMERYRSLMAPIKNRDVSGES